MNTNMKIHRHIAAGDPWDLAVWGLIVVLCAALFLDAMDVSMMGIALPSIGSHLHLTPTTLQWVVSGYVLGYGGFLLFGGRAADLVGRRRVFLISLGVYAVASMIGGLVDSGTLLVASRVIKGIAAAFTVPAGLSIITTTFDEGPARMKALSFYSASGAAGFSLGLVFGGLLTELGWRYAFLVPAPLAFALVIAAVRVVPRADESLGQHRHYDLAGAASITGSMLALVYSVVEAPTRGWGSPATLIGFAVSALLLIAFIRIESRSPHPLVRLGILKTHSLVGANVAGLLFFGSYIGFQFLGTLYMQDALGWSPVATAFAFLPAGMFLPILASQTGKLIGRLGTARLILGGLISFVGGYLLFLRADASPSYAAAILPTMLLVGLGWGLSFPSLNVQATSGVVDHEQGLASGLVNTSFQMGGAIIVAVVSAVISSHTTATGGLSAGILSALGPATGVVIAVAALGAVFMIASIAVTARRREANLAVVQAAGADA